MAGAELPKGGGTGKTALAGVDDLCATITDDDYRHHLHDLFEALGGRLEIIADFGDQRLAFTEPGNEAA